MYDPAGIPDHTSRFGASCGNKLELLASNYLDNVKFTFQMARIERG